MMRSIFYSPGIHRRIFPASPFFLLLAVLLLLVCGAVSSAAERKILVLHSYHQGYEWTDSIHRGIESELAPESDLIIHTEYLDTIRSPGEENLEGMRALLKRRYSERGVSFDVLLCTDDDALLFLLEHREELFGDAPVVFCGINDFTPEILGGRRNITGVNEAISARETIEVALKLRPKAKQLAVVSGARLSERRNLEIVKSIEHLFRERISFLYLEELEPERLASRLNELSPDDIVLYISYLLTPAGVRLSPQESVRLATEASPAPVFGCWDFLLPLGIAGGKVAHGHSQGTTAAALVRQILAGLSADDLPVVLESPNRYVFNHAVLERFGMPFELLPPYSLLLSSERRTLLEEWEEIYGEGWFGYRLFRTHGVPMLLLDPESGRILDANQAARSFYGYAKLEEINISSINTLPPEEIRAASHMARSLQQNHFEFQHRLADGSLRHVEVHVHPVFLDDAPLLFSMISDVTDRVIAEQQVERRNRWLAGGVLAALLLQSLVIALLARSRARREAAERNAVKQLNFSRSLIETMPNPVFYKDGSGRYLGCNAAYTEITGLREDDIYGKTVREVWSEDVGRAYARSDEEIYASGVVHHYQGKTVHVSGETRDVLFSKAPFLDENGAVAGIVGVITDITERKQTERALIESNRRLEESTARANELAEEAQAAHKARSEFLANMTHELLTPMNGVLGMNDLLLLDESLTAEQRRCAEAVHASAENLLALINRLLDVARIEAGELDLEAMDFDLSDVLKGFSSAMASAASEKELTFSVEVAPDVPTALRGDSWRLRQVLFNLTDNAIKFTPAGGGATVTVSKETESDNRVLLRFSVRDTGIGIPREKRELLFRNFSQVDGSATRAHGGAGLGLALSEKLAGMMGGTMGVSSEEGEGSEFWFTALFEKLSVRPEASEKATGRSKDGPIRVLFAEDSATNRSVVLGMLRKLGVEAEAAENGEKALAALSAAPYDLVLMDCQMPVIDGFEATRRIRAMEEPVGSIPIVALTANVMKGDREKCLAAGMNDYLAKPVTRRGLAEMLEKWLHCGTVFEGGAAVLCPEKEIPESEPPSESAAWNREVLLHRLDGDEELTDEVAAEFLEDMPNEFDALREALEKGDLVAAARYAHTIKGAAASVGGEPLRAVAFEAEKAGKAENAEGLAAFARGMEREFARLQDAMRRNTR